MGSSDFAEPDIEQLVQGEIKRKTLLYADKQLLANKRYRELVQGFRRRAIGTMWLMGFLLLMQVLEELLHIAVIDERWAPNWGRLFIATIFGFMFTVSLRDVRRCTRVLQSMTASSDAQ